MKRDKFVNLLTKFGIFLIIIYTIFLLGKSLWTNFNLRKAIGKLQTQIVTLEQQKRDLANLIVYYQSDSFKELEARRKLGLKKADEKVYIVPGAANTNGSFESDMLKDQNFAESKTVTPGQSNWSLWYQYLLGSDD